MEPTDSKTVVLGPEYDDELREVLRAVLDDMGARASRRDWGVAGSQELEALEVEIAGSRIRIEAETYVGVTLRGPGELVDALATRITARWSFRRAGSPK